MSEKTGKITRTLTINQQKLEAYLDNEEDTGGFLVAMGVISNEELAAAVHKDEEFRLKIEVDSSFADAKAKELDETGQVQEVVDNE